MNIFKLSWKNILAKPLNSIMSVLLFALSIGLITFLTLFNHQFKKGLENNLAGIDLVIGAKGSPLQLILNSMYHIDAPTGNIAIGEAAPFLNPKHPLLSGSIPLSLGDSYGAFRIVGTTPSIFKFYSATQVEGDIYKNDFDVVTGSGVADKLHLHIGDEFYSTHGLEVNPDLAHDHGHPFEVKGILQPTGTVLDQ
jgi:putative ABC transport system permease protein